MALRSLRQKIIHCGHFMSQTAPIASDTQPRWRKLRRGLKWGVRILLGMFGIYLAINLIGLIPVNNDFRPSPDGIEILVISNSVHADIVMPIKSSKIDWRHHFSPDCFSGDTSQATHVSIGWGDRKFFIETPTWADFRITTAAKALFWRSDCCLHVSFTNAETVREGSRSVKISDSQYGRLVDYINLSFRRSADGSKIQVANARYRSDDAFFLAYGTYSCLNTCNNWVGRSLRTAGIRTGWLTVMPKTVYLYLPD